MDFDCRKPLGDKLGLYLKDNLEEMCDELYNNGIIAPFSANIVECVCRKL